MAIRGRSCDNDRNCERPSSCSTPSSSVWYDGENIEEAGVYYGMPLNTALANLGKYVARGVSMSGAVKVQSFHGTSKIRLSSDPAEVLQVSLCGGILPPEYYRVEGRNIKICKDICQNEFDQVQVIYREVANTTYSFTC